MAVKDSKCIVENCEIQARCKGYCAKHYAEQVRKGNIVQRKKTQNTIEIKEEYAIIYLGEENEPFLIDIEDVDKLSTRKWGILRSKNNKHVYGRAKIKGKKVLMHRYIMNVENESVEVQVDHINGNTRDNRKSNLRICSASENGKNKAKSDIGENSHSGVCYEKGRGIWKAYITVDGKWKYLGVYDTEKEAIAAREEAEIKYFGEYRRDSHEE